MKLYREAKPLEICDGAEVFVKYLVPVEITEEEIKEILDDAYAEYHESNEEVAAAILSKLKNK